MGDQERGFIKKKIRKLIPVHLSHRLECNWVFFHSAKVSEVCPSTQGLEDSGGNFIRIGKVTGLSVKRCLRGSCQKLNPKSHSVEKLPVEMARMFFLPMGQQGWNGSCMVWRGKLCPHACNLKHRLDQIFFSYFFFSNANPCISKTHGTDLPSET